MNGPCATFPMDVQPSLRCYRDFNRLLDEQVVPYTVNETMIAAFRERLHRLGPSPSACYWLLTARTAELALLCAGHYADCGEIGAAGDLLVNPRRVDIHVRGADRPVVKDRHRPLSEQFNLQGRPFPAFTAWFRQNAVSRVVEPALLPDFQARLEASGWLSTALVSAFQKRMSRVADAMRFACVGTALPADHQCRFSDATYRLLGHDVERTCSDPTYHSVFLVDSWIREDTAATAADTDSTLPPRVAVQIAARH